MKKVCEICNQEHQGSGDICQLCHLGFNTHMAMFNDELQLAATLKEFIEKTDVPEGKWHRASFYFKKIAIDHHNIWGLQVENLKSNEVK